MACYSCWKPRIWGNFMLPAHLRQPWISVVSLYLALLMAIGSVLSALDGILKKEKNAGVENELPFFFFGAELDRW